VNNNDNNGMAITSNTPAHELTLELDSPQATSATGYINSCGDDTAVLTTGRLVSHSMPPGLLACL
jgi:hypothetical protein